MSIQLVNKAVLGGGGGGSQCLSYKEQMGGRGGRGGHSHKQSEVLGGVLWVYKIGLK